MTRTVLIGVAASVVGTVVQVAVRAVTGAGDPYAVLTTVLVLLAVPVAVGVLLARRAPHTPVAAALTWLGAAPCVVFAAEAWGSTAGTGRPWPAAGVPADLQTGAWVWNVAGFAALCLVFPNGLLPGRRWRQVAWGAPAAGVLITVAQGAVGRPGQGRLVTLPAVGVVVLGVSSLVVCLAAVVATGVSLVVRYRRGDDRVRQQMRWLLLGAGTVPVLLVAGWVMQGFGLPPGVAYIGLFVSLLVLVPAAVAVAVLRHDLFDVDRLLGASLAWLLTTVGSAALFAVVVTLGGALGAGSRIGVTGAAFATALVLLPMHRRLNEGVGRLVDRDRYVVADRVRRFVDEVRAGTAEPEQAEDVFRTVLADPGLRLLLHRPGGDGYVSIGGEPALGGLAEPDRSVPLRSGSTDVGVLVLGTGSARRVRRAREVAFQARLPIEVSRLRLHLREALRDVRSSRTRLMSAAAEERRSLERDLHDGAQQQIVSVGMRLRSTQRRLAPGSAEHGELDAAVEALEATIGELRRLAHGIRPSRLGDGLPAALRDLVAHAPVPVRLTVATEAVSDLVSATAYFVVAEAYTNALKHARAAAIEIGVTLTGRRTLRIVVSDDGVGGAGGGLTSVRDRVASLGGTVEVAGPPGGGTRVEVEIPDAHRPR